MHEMAAYSTMAMTLGLVVARPHVGPTFRITPALAAVIGALFLTAIGVVKPGHAVDAITNLKAPFIAIASMMVMTEVASRVGLLGWWASRIEARARTTGALFALVFGVGVLTSSLLNNDAAILVLTPVVLTMVARRYPGRPAMLVPFAFAVFMSAGVAALPVANPMNMVVADFSGIDFNTYARQMIPVAIAGWAIAFVMLRLVFRAPLRAPIEPTSATAQRATPIQQLTMVLLVAVLAAYPIVGSFGGPVWAVALGGAILSLVVINRHHRTTGDTTSIAEVVVRGVSWETLVFLLAVLVMSFGLRDVGLVDRLASLYGGGDLGVIGVSSALGSAVLNNHPMSHLNMMALASAPHHDTAVFAALVGGDLGPRLLPMGSLAGLLWIEQLRRHGLELRIGLFVRVGVLLAVPTIAASLAILAW
ncbi:MAG: anion permease [Deltaproteobacteria bacterium]|nr:anion permease [Deltaproteobacteria bacterium]